MDLGTKDSKGEPVPAAAGQEGPKIHYPSFSVRDEKFDAITEEHALSPEDEGTATIHFRVSGMNVSEYGRSIELQVTQIEDIEKNGKGESKEEEDEEEGKGSHHNPAIRKAMRRMKA